MAINNTKQNRAKQVLDALGWDNYEAYLQDMQVLLPLMQLNPSPLAELKR